MSEIFNCRKIEQNQNLSRNDLICEFNKHRRSFITHTLPCIIGLLFLNSCDSINSKSTMKAAICADADTISSLKSIVFRDAKEGEEWDPALINDWEKSFKASIELPLLKGIEKDISKATCSARLLLTIPENQRVYFAGDNELKADLTYFVQPSADNTGNLTGIIDGGQFVIERIAEANSNALQKKAEVAEQAVQAAETARLTAQTTENAKITSATDTKTGENAVSKTMYVATKQANIRLQADPSSGIVAKLNFGEALQIVDTTDVYDKELAITRTWYKVSQYGYIGWISSRITSETKLSEPITFEK